MFTIRAEARQRWSYEVRWNNGRTICRADSARDAQRIADAE